MAKSFLRTTVHYSGRVQGVGFRYTVYQIAKGHEVAGFVENLPDGRVLLVAEGREDEVTGFLDSVANSLSGFIRGSESVEERSVPKHAGFTIR